MPEGTKLVFEIIPKDDYKLTDLAATVNPETNGDEYTLTVGEQDITIKATTERKSATFNLSTENGVIEFLGATYTTAAGVTENYGTDFSDYAAPFGYNKESNTVALPLGATVTFKINPRDGYYVASVAYADTELTATDGFYTLALSEENSSLNIDFGKSVVTYETIVTDIAKTPATFYEYAYHNNLQLTNAYDVDYVKIVTEGENVTKTSLISTDEPISVTLDAGKLGALKPSYARTFVVVYQDADGTFQPLGAAYNAENNTVTFSTTSFNGLFAVAYVDSYDEALLSVLDFSGVSKDTILTFDHAIYNGNKYTNLAAAGDSFSWTPSKATFPIGTIAYFTVSGNAENDLTGVFLNGAAISADSETSLYAFTATETGTFSLSATTSRKAASLSIFASHGTVTITSATFDGEDVSKNLVAGAVVILTVTPNSGYVVDSTSTTGITSVAKNPDGTYRVVLSGGANTFTVGFVAEGGSSTPGSSSGSGSGSSTDTPGGPISTPDNPSPNAPIGGGSQDSSGNSEYFLPEDENGVVKVDNPLKNITAKLSSLTVGKKQLTVKLSKVKNAAGYQIVYRVKGATTWKTTTTTSLTKTIKSLKKGKKYEVKTRAYKKVAGQTFYSKWSAVKTSAKIK